MMMFKRCLKNLPLGCSRLSPLLTPHPRLSVRRLRLHLSLNLLFVTLRPLFDTWF